MHDASSNSGRLVKANCSERFARAPVLELQMGSVKKSISAKTAKASQAIRLSTQTATVACETRFGSSARPLNLFSPAIHAYPPSLDVADAETLLAITPIGNSPRFGGVPEMKPVDHIGNLDDLAQPSSAPRCGQGRGVLPRFVTLANQSHHSMECRERPVRIRYVRDDRVVLVVF